jgi:hypothetical protein
LRTCYCRQTTGVTGVHQHNQLVNLAAFNWIS